MVFVRFPLAFERRLAKLWKPFFSEIPSIDPFSVHRVVRVNTLKIEPLELKNRLESLGFVLSGVPFCSYAFFVRPPLKRSLGSTIEHALGYFFVQDGASLLPVLALSPKPGERVLDMAAAPGGKATHIAQQMENDGALVAMDSNRHRLPALRYSFARFGVVNALVVFESGVRLAAREAFDRVLLDAPCSCEGLGFSDPSVWAYWSEKLVLDKSALQKKLIVNAFDALRIGGTLVYSTCTLSPEENEFVLAHLLASRPNAELVPLSVAGIDWVDGVVEWDGVALDPRVALARRVYTPLTHTESFFVAKVQKVR